MTPLFKKLNFKNQPHILVVDHPPSFQSELDAMAEEAEIITDPAALESITFCLAFATEQAAIKRQIDALAPRLADDAVIWFCYPKKSSKNYQSDITRDAGWEPLGEWKLEPVRQVAIDADWSALRFRPVDQIKSFTRRKSMALTKEGKKRTDKN